MELQKMISRSNPNANQRVEQWAAQNSFLFNTTHLLPRNSPILIRKNASQMGKAEKERFLSAIKTLNSIKAYGNQVVHHTKHELYLIHSMNGPKGAMRFLPWHRIYIFELEEMLQAFEPGISIPYWDWENERQIPEWLNNFTPDVPSDNETFTVIRRPPSSRTSFLLPSKTDVEKLLSISKYADFTSALEHGIPTGPKETETTMHNAVHNWVGGTMATMNSPADILFWLHHANIDRIWAKWQHEHPAEHPDLRGTDAIMNPWTDHNEEETRSIENLRYKYK